VTLKATDRRSGEWKVMMHILFTSVAIVGVVLEVAYAISHDECENGVHVAIIALALLAIAWK
jgi:hypothetical protein